MTKELLHVIATGKRQRAYKQYCDGNMDCSDYTTVLKATRTAGRKARRRQHRTDANNINELLPMAGRGNNPVQGFRTLRELHWVEFTF
jgi:hypothetical protein